MYSSNYYNSYESDNNADSWLHITHGISTSEEKYSERDEWTMSYAGFVYYSTAQSGDAAWYISSDGTLTLDGSPFVWNAYAIRPVFYLTPSILLTGEGSEEHPFIITNVRELNS